MNVFDKIKGGLIVSCQALETEPLYSSKIMARMAFAAKEGGAVGIRANTPEDIIAIKKEVNLPVIGLYKVDYDNSEIYITPTMKEIDAIMTAAPDIIALDATNRKRPDGWLAPSVRQKIETHITVVENVMKILPVTKIIVETASFDIQKIKNPEIEGVGYQHGEQLDFWNVREYVLFRDGHTCQCCKGKSKDNILNVHHIESRKTGGNAPNNLITLCETCHKAYHKGIITLPKEIHRGVRFRDAAFMGIMRWAFYDRLKELYTPFGVTVVNTYGYITKNTRITYDLPKEHYVDARCISGNPAAKPMDYYYLQKKVRCHNRQIHKCKINKGGTRKRNQAAYEVKGFRLYDQVLWKGQKCFIFARRSTGRMDLRLLDGTHVNASVGYKNLKLLSMRKNYLIEQRKAG